MGYQNNEIGISLEYPKTWSTSEGDYIGQAKGIGISNKELGVGIGITYLRKGLEGQTGPSGMANEMVKKGSFTLAGKTLDRYYNIRKDEKGINIINRVYYSDPNMGIQFFLRDLQFTISIARTTDEDYELSPPLTPDKIQKAEQILSTFKFID